MGWTDGQRRIFLAGASAAGWNDQMRYVAMRHVGCPNFGCTGRPSVKHPRNTHGHLELLMALAESQCQPSRRFPVCQSADSWAKAEGAWRHRLEDLAVRIQEEAVDRLPAHFDDGLIGYAVRHTTGNDPDTFNFRPTALTDCDAGQLYRVIECMKAIVGRRMLECGMQPRSFDVPAGARRRTGQGGPAHVTNT